MQVTLSSVATQHAQALEQESETANKRLSDLMDAWHTRSAATLGGFGATVKKATDDLSASWQQLSGSVSSEIGQLVRGWQTSLDKVVTEMKSSLATVNGQLKKTETLSEALLKSAQALTKSADAVSGASPMYSDRVLQGLIKKLESFPEQIAQIIATNSQRIVYRPAEPVNEMRHSPLEDYCTKSSIT